MKRAISGLVIALVFAVAGEQAHADVVIEKRGDAHHVEADTYEAVVEKDGCLASIKVGGVEFLAPGVSISRGSYLYLGGPVKLPQVRVVAEQHIDAVGEHAAIRYSFHDDSMTWTIRSKADKEMPFFLVMRPEIVAARGRKDDWRRPPLKASWSESAWYRDGQRMAIKGGDRQWGPWAGQHQVWEAKIAPGKMRSIRFVLGEASGIERRGIDRLLDPFQGRQVLLEAPLDYQVFQRHKRREGHVIVRGRTKIPIDRVDVQFTGRSKRGRLPKGWQPVMVDEDQMGFEGRFTLPAGGWYGGTVRVTARQAVIQTIEVEHFGVGEVFVGAGQSNSTNSGQERIRQKSGRVSSFSGSAWRIANDPQPGCHDGSQGGSFWPAFGDAMVKRFDVPIGVATTGHGGTSVNRWQPGGDLFTWTLTRIKQLGPNGFRALLWHQGESDVRMKSDEYYEKLKTIIEASKREAAWDFPWFVAQVSYHNPQNTSFETTRSAQARLWKEGVALEGPDTDTLQGDHRDYGGKGIHFSPKGLKAHGRMWAKLVGDWLKPLLAR